MPRMTLRKRLHLSFLAMIIIPCILFAFTLFIMIFALSGEDGITNSEIGLENIEKKNEILAEMKLSTTSEPELFEDAHYLRQKAKMLEEQNIALFIRINDDVTNYSNLFDRQLIAPHLPPFGKFVDHVHESVPIGEEDYKFEQHDFYFPDDREGSIFLVKTASPLEQSIITFLPYLFIFLIIIIFVTNGTLSYFVSRSILRPLYALKLATEKIKSGNLDFKIEMDRKDEIGDLIQDFEKMRQKLKESLEIQQQYEENRKLLISNISHDLKTPITSIKGYVEGIRDGVANTAEKQQKYVNTIYKKATEMDALINELFLFSTLDLKRVPFQFKKTNIVSFINECISDLSIELERNQIELIFHNDIGPTVLVNADQEKLVRVFNNIIQNSVKYLDKDHRQIVITLKGSDGFVAVTIADNGPGIHSEDLPHIFQTFYRADKSRNSKTGGTGLGLAISKQIIEAHGGRIWAESAIDQGLTIHFTLQLFKEHGDEI